MIAKKPVSAFHFLLIRLFLLDVLFSPELRAWGIPHARHAFFKNICRPIAESTPAPLFKNPFEFPCDNRQIFGKLEWNCILELYGASSPQEVEKAIHVVRNKIESTIANMGEHLCSFRQYRRKGKIQGEKGR